MWDEHEEITLSLLPETDTNVSLVPYLVVAFQRSGADWLASRHWLCGVDEVMISRGTSQTIQREGSRMLLELRDSFVSSPHAILRRYGVRWTIEDCNSKNGLSVNSVECLNTVLTGTDVIEVGRTILVFGNGVMRSADEPLDRVLPKPQDCPLGLPTLAPSLAADLEALALVVRSELPVMISGESGTGKEVLARAIHLRSGRRGAFVAVNCGALPENLVESELYGYRRGAFSGALEDRLGLIRSADGGTLLLDEIGDLPLRSQTALLRVLQEREVLAVGGTRPTPVDVRIVCATHRDLSELVEAGTFRADLRARLSGFQLTLPPLHQRREDLGALVQTLCDRLAPADANIELARSAVAAFFHYRWPLNIRELEKCLSAALLLADGRPIGIEHLPKDLRVWMTHVRQQLQPKEPPPRPEEQCAHTFTLAQVERRYILETLNKVGWNKRRAAGMLGISRPTLDRKIEQYALDPSTLGSHSRARVAGAGT